MSLGSVPLQAARPRKIASSDMGGSSSDLGRFTEAHVKKYLQEINFSNLPRLEEEPPQIGGGTVSRSSCLKSYFFLIPKPFSENSRTADSKNAQL